MNLRGEHEVMEKIFQLWEIGSYYQKFRLGGVMFLLNLI